MSDRLVTKTNKMMTAIPLTRGESLQVADLLLFSAIIHDESDVAISIIQRFNLTSTHRMMGLCDPMSYLSHHFLEFAQFKDNGSSDRRRVISAINILEEKTVQDFCVTGIHPLDLAIQVDALATFHALLDIGYKDINSKSVFLSIKSLKPDMLSRLMEEGFDLWSINSEWDSRPIDYILTLASFREDLYYMYVYDSVNRLAECLRLVLGANSDPSNLLLPDSRKEHPTKWNGGRVIRNRSFGIPELDYIMSYVCHGIDI